MVAKITSFPNDLKGAARTGFELPRRWNEGTFPTMTKDIDHMLRAQPFQPFLIHTADGRRYRVPTPDHAHVSPSGGRVSVWEDDETESILPGLLISGLVLVGEGMTTNENE